MPIYEYRCSSCGHELEALQKFSDPALTTCPSCRAETLVKRVSAAGFQLKGSGWYVTDFRGGGKASPGAAKPGGEASGSAPTDAPGAKSEAKSETKTEAKTEAKGETKAGTPTPTAGSSS